MHIFLTTIQVTTAAVEQYTGEGEPPYCEMTLRATDAATDKQSIFELLVTLTGVRKQPHNTLCVQRVLETSDGVLLYNFFPILGKSVHSKCDMHVENIYNVHVILLW